MCFCAADRGSDTDSEGYLSLLLAEQEARLAQAKALLDPAKTGSMPNFQQGKVSGTDSAALQLQPTSQAEDNSSGQRGSPIKHCMSEHHSRTNSARKTLKGIHKHHRHRSKHKSKRN